MATSLGKCPRCECEGKMVGCELCFYSGFKCKGNCACCADLKESSTKTQASASSGIVQRESTQQQARASSNIVQRESTQQQARASKSNNQTESTEKKMRIPFRPLILRNVKKALADNQKAACSNVPQSKAGNSKVSESCTNKVNPTVGESDENKVNLVEIKLISNKVNSEVKETNSNKVNQPKVKVEPKNVMVNAETQTPPEHEVTHVIASTSRKIDISIQLIAENKVEPDVPASRKESANKEYEDYIMRLWNNLFWPQWDKVPCAPHVPPQNERKPNILTKEKLQEGINSLIGDQCLNCNCTRRNPRDPCDICRRTDFQCLGSCLCCANFRAGQRRMIFVTRGLYKLADGKIYGGGNVYLSNVVSHISELSKAVTATISAFSRVIFIALNRYTTLLSGMLMNMRQALLSYF